ncbi:hypothetical protein BGZ96_011475 [Linnemannia gamsii]|uniref:Phosphatidic acid phosphatase type 2/haloperoxidase domain-containing protein n=1 Tax=Linnemannia gamsii TaxID=64522 RepID=A0ABQ7JS97_9FUNG|nr:hypothetical protein BGZ96_011475 [Linnemannia gamsii]
MGMFRIKSPKTRFYFSYIFDWIFCVILLGLFFLLDRVEPFHREFSVENTAIMYTYEENEAVPVWALGLIVAVFPALVMLIVSIGLRRSPYDFHNGLLGLLLSVLLTTIFTQVLKVTVGKHRPDFLARCIPMLDGVLLVRNRPLKLWNVSVCTQTDADILKDGMRSFPSGHASSMSSSSSSSSFNAAIQPDVFSTLNPLTRLQSSAFAGLVYLSLWMAGKMHVFDRKGYSLKPVLLFMPILGAILIAVSRVDDYRHSATDVTWGAIIGIFFAVFSYHQYYPSPTAMNSQIPHPCRDFSKPHRGGDDDVGHLENAIGIRRNSGDFIDESGRLEVQGEGQEYDTRGYADGSGGYGSSGGEGQLQQNQRLPQHQQGQGEGAYATDAGYHQVSNSNGQVYSK